MNYKEFMKAFLSSNTSGIYLIDSEEEYLKETIIDAAKDILRYPDFNYIEIKGKTSIEEIQTAMDTYPIMEDKKVIIWRNVDFSQKNIKEYEEVNNSLIKTINNVGDFLTLLIIPDSKIFKGKFYKNVKKNGQIVEVKRLTNNELIYFIGKRFLKFGKKIKKSQINDIIARFSYLNKNSEVDLYEVVNTIDKIISNSDQMEVKDIDVSEQLDQILDLNIFNFTDALSMKNSKKALDTYFYMARDIDEIFKIYHMLVRHIRNLIGIKVLSNNSFNDSYIMKTLSISFYELNKDKSFVRNFTLDELFNIHDFLYNMERKQKSLDFDMNLNMEMLISSFSK
ncbi:DNA polymerase III subunit delta [Anaerococcus sp. AGMB00486]|uniref:DNA polymerase III subunit delta n=2 Tax=Anaerococcus TaxID=165779 RepID=A0ABX2NBB9_9FIRM|nr:MULTISPECIES: DNA polymerase III subunit delta [Anaerococcus]MSS78215.1 DNA polymerase III subunit delta [Anaerococcus porci]NVF11973.1 DNA polymerase III subunit delta [Anaerococcus faecalis]